MYIPQVLSMITDDAYLVSDTDELLDTATTIGVASIGATLIFSLFAFAICLILLVFYFKTVKKGIKFAKPDDSGTLELVLVFFLPFVSFYLTEKKISAACAERGIPHDDRSILYLILGIFGFHIIDAILMHSDLKKLGA